MLSTREGASSSPSAISTLRQCFADPLTAARVAHRSGQHVVGAVAHTVPWEILRAAGVAPVVVRPPRSPAVFCDEFLEPGVFSLRIRALFESTLAGDLTFLSALVFPRSSEQDYKAYLYLREAAREGQEPLPATWLYDVLYSPSSHAYDYGLARTRELAARLEALTGRVIRDDDFEAAIAEGNAARAAARQLLSLRGGPPRINGVEALALLGSLFLIDRVRYTTLALRAAAEAAGRTPLQGPRLAVAGAWVDDERLHALLEAHGAVVVAEDGGWGSRGAGRDVEPGADFIAAIFAKYHRDGPGVRQFPADDRAWLDALSGSTVDGVVFYLPPDDSVRGWDVPLARRRLDARGIPSLVIRDDIDDPAMPERWHERVAAFVAQTERRH